MGTVEKEATGWALSVRGTMTEGERQEERHGQKRDINHGYQQAVWIGSVCHGECGVGEGRGVWYEDPLPRGHLRHRGVTETLAGISGQSSLQDLFTMSGLAAPHSVWVVDKAELHEF